MITVPKSHTITLLAGIAVAAAIPAQAQLKIKGNDAYWNCPNGHVVTDGNGRCVRTIAWTKDLAIPECEGGTTVKKAEAPKPAPAPAAAPAPAPAPVAEKVTLKAGALFDVGKADLKPAGMRELDDLAAKLKGMSNIESIGVTGHTDNLGNAALNQALSEQRAANVKTYLVGKGVDGNKITTRGAGAAQPVATNATAEGRAQNRRVELDIKASQ